MREYTFDEIVILITADETTGDETRSRSYASIASVRGSETYQAMTVGLKPELMIVLPDWHADYHGEQQVEYGDNSYRVLRAYQTEDGRAELTVYRLRPGVSEANSFL
jgi:hypothetical protein